MVPYMIAPGADMDSTFAQATIGGDALREPLLLPRRMTPSDALFWYAETALPVFRPIIAGLYILDGHADARRMDACFDAMLDLVPRLRQRVAEAPCHLGLPEWIDDLHFDRAYHVRHVSVGEPGTLRELLDLAAALLATPLDHERPLWEAYRIDGLEGGRSALFMKTHHAVVDGVGALTILDGLTQRHPDDPPLRVAVRRRRGRRSTDTNAVFKLLALLRDNTIESLRLARETALAPVRFAMDPGATIEQVTRTVRGLCGAFRDMSSAPIRDPLVESTSGLSRRLDVLSISLARLRRIKAPLGVTVNDVVLTALAGGLGGYHRRRQVTVAALNCMVPMNLRSARERDRLGNRVGMMNIVLPVGELQARRRLEHIVAQTRAAKSDRRGALYPFLMQTVTMIPGPVLGWVARQSLGRVNVACTNIPGVSEARYLAGVQVEAIYPFASVVEGTPLVIALLSYADRLDIGIDTDPEAIPDPHAITELFMAELDELERLSHPARGPGPTPVAPQPGGLAGRFDGAH